ncbi:kinesin-like protein KIF14 isoform X1 [Stigmatopora argus]
MSLFSVQAKKHTAYYDHLMSAGRTPARQCSSERKSDKTTAKCELGDSNKPSILNRTYVISALSKSGQTPYRGRLTLQRRSRQKTRSDSADETANNVTTAAEKKVTLQRRTKTPSMDKSAQVPRVISIVSSQETAEILQESNGRTLSLCRSIRSRETSGKEEVTNPLENQGKLTHNKTLSSSSHSRSSSTSRPSDEQARIFKTPTKKTPFQKIAARRDVFEKLTVKPTPKLVKSASLERSKLRVSKQAENSRPVPVPRTSKPGVLKATTPFQVRSTPATSCLKPENTKMPATVSAPMAKPSLPRPSEVSKTEDSLKMENSAVTVAVRVRPFNAREKAANASQVIFMRDQETVVQYPDSKQRYSFTYDFSLYSVDSSEHSFASQQMVYETLAKPLLIRAFDGFNTCLFAYGQTGSGKSYTMMGFEEEAGVIPRFCQELFVRLSSMETDQVKCHVEMSYLEVYNEKIHDLLVTRDDPNQRRMPLRVREHPIHGPYVEELSVNVVGSFSDIQGWLELGNKQRATAATGMNEKSSRSHSVFTLVMTQTKTEMVEGEEHDHNITSKINLVDLAGSERSNSAQTSGDRLREGASVNKSLLTLGKVISALADQALTKKKIFIPYRESVLTWLLKESLGGNSKTAMIATLSPAASSVEESLSTLRYAQKARTIINVAKVNEDTNARLIRDLKAEVEKLRAAQASTRGIEPERVKLFQQEITALKSKLCQQEREMVEANREWREKLDRAEIRKREETKELQKSGVTFKVDNRLPNLVNLNEDPQLSEMLLYMIKEGQTTVGKLKSDCTHDIQLTGALIADQHCIITNTHGTVSINPIENAKTFVNGNLISDAIVLHHGDRIILGGDHYFRFNHPAEVQSGKRVSCWTGAREGHKDFEFAKNELLEAQRAELEAEIEEAQVKAKKEMMQGIQMAKEVAQKELSDQKALYEDKIRVMEQVLNEENERKRLQDLDQQRVASQMEELKMANMELEQEVDSQKKRLRLHMEAQVMKEHHMSQAKIVEALEAEKKKLNKELEDMQKKRAVRLNTTTRNESPHWDAMKLSLMVEEANKISAKLKKNTVFSRHGSSVDGYPGQGDVLQVRVQNTKLGISTFWSLDKFQNNMAAMREMEQEDLSSKDDVFYAPDDEWEQDITTSSGSSSSFSRRRSRSLLKGKRLSGRLYEIRVHPIQSLLKGSTHSDGLMGVATPPSTSFSTTDSAVPRICKELIGQSVARLRGFGANEESLGDRLASSLHGVYEAMQTISDLYDSLDDDSQENVFACNLLAQTQLIKATAATESSVFVTTHWLDSVKASSGPTYTLAEELKSQVKKMGGFLQLLIQGCESEITSMVAEARKKSGQCLGAALLALCHLSALSGMPLSVMELGMQATGKASFVPYLLKGTNKGVQSILAESLIMTREILREAQLAHPSKPEVQCLKTKTLDLACSLQNYIYCCITQEFKNDQEIVEEGGNEASDSKLQTLRNTAATLFKLNQAIRQLQCTLSNTMKGDDRHAKFSSSREFISSSAKTLDEVIHVLSKEAVGSSRYPPSGQTMMATQDKLHCALRSLTLPWDQQEAVERRGTATSQESKNEPEDRGSSQCDGRSRGNITFIHSLPVGVKSNDSLHWV